MHNISVHEDCILGTDMSFLIFPEVHYFRHYKKKVNVLMVNGIDLWQ